MARFLAQNSILPDHAWIHDLERNVTLQVQQIVTVHDRVRDVETDAHITIRKNRAILNHRSVIDKTIALHVAATGNQTLLFNPRPAPDECRGDNSCPLVNLSPFDDPDTRPRFSPGWTETAARSEGVSDQTAQVSGSHKAVDIAAYRIGCSHHSFQDGQDFFLFAFDNLRDIENPEIQRAIFIEHPRHRLALVLMKLKCARQSAFDVCSEANDDGCLNPAFFVALQDLRRSAPS